MNFQWAIEKLKEGKKVRRKSDKCKSYRVFYDDKDIRYLASGGNEGAFWTGNIEEFEATDWEIFEEFSIETIQEGKYEFMKKNTAIPNKIVLHPESFKKLHLEDGVKTILGMELEINDGMNKTEALVYFESSKESLSDKAIHKSHLGMKPTKEDNIMIFQEKDVREKIQNAQKRLKEGNRTLNDVDKIFKEEFGGKLL